MKFWDTTGELFQRDCHSVQVDVHVLTDLASFDWHLNNDCNVKHIADMSWGFVLWQSVPARRRHRSKGGGRHQGLCEARH